MQLCSLVVILFSWIGHMEWKFTKTSETSSSESFTPLYGHDQILWYCCCQIVSLLLATAAEILATQCSLENQQPPPFQNTPNKGYTAIACLFVFFLFVCDIAFTLISYSVHRPYSHGELHKAVNMYFNSKICKPTYLVESLEREEVLRVCRSLLIVYRRMYSLYVCPFVKK